MTTTLTTDQRRRFWAKVQKTPGCWLWTGATSDFGHGTVRIDGKLYRAHRIVWELKHGNIPNDLCVLHKCDVPSCVRPSHLFLGTKGDNSKDMRDKHRWKNKPYPTGTDHPNNKLTEDDVRAIRNLLLEGVKQKDVAAQFGVAQTQVSSINTRKSWAWLQ